MSQWLADPATPPAAQGAARAHAADPRLRRRRARRARQRQLSPLRRPAARRRGLERGRRARALAAAEDLVLRGRRLRRLPRLLRSRRGRGVRRRRCAATSGSRSPSIRVPAYSTLGKLPGADWLADPLLNTFIDYPEGDLARLIFHELAHQVAFAPRRHPVQRIVRQHGREASAPSAGSAGRRTTRPGSTTRAARRAARDFRALTSRYRDELAALYQSDAPEAAPTRGQGRADGAPARRLRGAEGRPAGTATPATTGWFAEANNASFGVLASYTALVPAFERLFEREGRRLPRASTPKSGGLPPCRPTSGAPRSQP